MRPHLRSGLAEFPALIIIGVMILTCSRGSRIFWALLAAGTWFGVAFVFWLAYASSFQLWTGLLHG
ncbi:vitamin K epoxide reductase family protein [Microbacterium indicum]|uniref:vitamin K epoxide reductase family protein n=1 Tax=Microbacterium indicum TaxID=358100 RepID=UPI0004200255